MEEWKSLGGRRIQYTFIQNAFIPIGNKVKQNANAISTSVQTESLCIWFVSNQRTNICTYRTLAQGFPMHKNRQLLGELVCNALCVFIWVDGLDILPWNSSSHSKPGLRLYSSWKKRKKREERKSNFTFQTLRMFREMSWFE